MLIGIKDTVTFVGRSVEELKQALADSVEDYLELCAENGEEPDRPYRGDFVVRASPELHRAVAARAATSGVSMNAWIVSALETAVAKKRPATGRSSARRKAGRTPSA